MISNDFFPPTDGSARDARDHRLIKNMQSVDSSVPVTSFTVVAAALNDVIKGVGRPSSAATSPATRS